MNRRLFNMMGMFAVSALTAQAALVQHLDASVSGSVTGSPVTAWSDLSGSGNHAAPAVGDVYYPGISLSASGEQGIDFGADRNSLELFSASGSDSWLDQSAGTGGFCVLVAFKCDGLIGNWNDLIGNSTTVGTGFGMRYSDTGAYQIYLNGNLGAGGTVGSNDTVVFALNYDAATGDWEFWDSNNGGTQTGNTTAADFSTGNSVTLGSTSASGRYFNGMAGEVKIFSHELSDAEFTSERNQLTDKWINGVAASGWRVIPEMANYPTDDIIVAYCAVTDSAYGLPADTVNSDCTAAFQAALDDAGAAGGGTVFVPAGEYRIEGMLDIDSNVILRGRWRELTSGFPTIGTVLSLYNTGTNAIFNLGGSGCGVRDLTFWHPNQDASSPTAYPFVIRGNGSQTTIENITLVNAYNGIDMSKASMCCLRGIYGSPLHVGLTADQSYAVSRFDSIHFSPDYWAWSGLPGSPSINGPHKAYIRSNAVAVNIKEMDGFYFSFTTISGYLKGVFFQAGISGDDPHGDMSYVTISDCDIAMHVEEAKSFKILGCTFAGSVYGIYGQDNTTYNINTSVVEGGVNALHLLKGGATLVNCNVTGSSVGSVKTAVYPTVMPVFNNTYDKVRKPLRKTLFNVKDYGAVGNGTADDTAAIQSAVAAANANGGGIVFVPDGEYRMTGNLALANGVELRGNSGGRHIASAKTDKELASLLLIETGQGDENGTPFITMGDRSGLRGIAFHYPVQADPDLMPHPDPDSTYFIPYPYMVQANGVKNYIIDCFASNPYQAAELNGDDHLVEYTFFGGLRRTYRANNCSGGRIQNCHVKPDFWRDIWLPGNPKDNLGGFKWEVNKILEVFYLNNCTDYSISSIFNHASHAFMTVDNSSGQTLMISAEQVQQGYTLLNGSKTFDFLNSSCNINVIGDRSGTYGIKSFPGYDGFARYYVSSIWGTSDETWAGNAGHLYLQQCYFSGPSNRGAMNLLCGADGAMSLHACDAGEMNGLEKQGAVVMQDCSYPDGFMNSAAPEYLADNAISKVFVLADVNQDPPQAFGLALNTNNIVMEDALIMVDSTPASVSKDGRRVRAARLTSGNFSLDVTDPGFTDGAKPNVEFVLYFLVDTACTIKTYYHNGTAMVLGDSRSYDGSVSGFWKEYSFSENNAWFGTTEDIRIEIVGDSPLLAKVAVRSSELPGAIVSSGYDGWAKSYGGPGLIGFEAYDYDGDGQANLAEYALDGDPLDKLNIGEQPTIGSSGGSVNFIHPQRADDAGLIYIVETSTNLVSNVWTNMGYAVSGTNVTGSTLDYVTNAVPTNYDQSYLRLKIGH